MTPPVFPDTLRACSSVAPGLVGCKEDMERVLDWYGQRWRIEAWHRTLKAGCKVEYPGATHEAVH